MSRLDFHAPSTHPDCTDRVITAYQLVGTGEPVPLSEVDPLARTNLDCSLDARPNWPKIQVRSSERPVSSTRLVGRNSRPWDRARRRGTPSGRWHCPAPISLSDRTVRGTVSKRSPRALDGSMCLPNVWHGHEVASHCAGDGQVAQFGRDKRLPAHPRGLRAIGPHWESTAGAPSEARRVDRSDELDRPMPQGLPRAVGTRIEPDGAAFTGVGFGGYPPIRSCFSAFSLKRSGTFAAHLDRRQS